MAVTMRDVAKLAGVSQRTVSNVVSGHEHVKPETRQRVQDAVQALRYRPNVSAQRLRQGRGHTGLLALAIPEIAAPYFAELADQVQRAADEAGFTLLVDQTAGAWSREMQVLDGFRSSVFDGVILNAMSLTPQALAQHGKDVPVVLLGEVIDHGGLLHVSIDNLTAAREATEHLLTQGRRRVAVLGTPRPGQRPGPAQRRLDGFLTTMDAADCPVPPQRRLETIDWTLTGGYAAGRRLVEDRVDLDGLLCFNDTLALGAMKALTEAGRRVPDDVAVVGWDGTAAAAYATPGLTTIAPDKSEIAAMAVEGVLALIAGDPVIEKEVMAAHTLIVRGSSVS